MDQRSGTAVLGPGGHHGPIPQRRAAERGPRARGAIAAADLDRSPLRPATAGPIVYVAHRDGYGVVGSNFGLAHHPARTTNLLRDPHAVVSTAGQRIPVTARLVEGEEREEIWRQLVASTRATRPTATVAAGTCVSSTCSPPPPNAERRLSAISSQAGCRIGSLRAPMRVVEGLCRAVEGAGKAGAQGDEVGSARGRATAGPAGAQCDLPSVRVTGRASSCCQLSRANHTPRGRALPAQDPETGHKRPHRTGWTALDGFYDMCHVGPS
ncbi:nitroreductase/quinone reductase family protein [Streptomyces mirabilis]|uniref:nitroreductase/quinone reductase family protein n=1 Tax=Streptomyces mirabilis TaxID=68239 RepID=UPI0033C53FE0